TDGPDGWAVDSFTWATAPNGGAVYPGPWLNRYGWPRAREYELNALTLQATADRNNNFALMFRSLGQVLHLNQDLSQPSHVRNDNHLLEDNVSFIEAYGLRHLNEMICPPQFLDWR